MTITKLILVQFKQHMKTLHSEEEKDKWCTSDYNYVKETITYHFKPWLKQQGLKTPENIEQIERILSLCDRDNWDEIYGTQYDFAWPFFNMFDQHLTE